MRARWWRKPTVPAALAVVALLLTLPLWACGGGDEVEERKVPATLRTRFNTEMMAILRDIRLAQETARAVDGGYVDWAELRRSYLSRHIPSKYEIEMKDLTPTSYRVEILHPPSGLRCRLEVADAGAPGSPTCS